MSEKINLSEMLEKSRAGDKEAKIIEWAVISAICEEKDDFFKKDEKGEFVLDVEFKINGEKFKFSKTLLRIFEHFNSEVKVVAAKLVEEKMDKVFEEIEESAEDLKECVSKTICDKFGMKKDEYGEYHYIKK